MKLFILVFTLLLSNCNSKYATHKTKEELAKEERELPQNGDSSSVASPVDYTSKADNKIRVISYNVLKYGDGCQGPINILHNYLQRIVHYTSPDILGLVKVNAFKSPGDNSSEGPLGFADSILDHALNKAYTGRYAACPVANYSGGDNMNILFYDKNKFGFSSMTNLCTAQTDFNLYKLFVRKHTGPDSLFLYFILNHTKSGEESAKRDAQANCIIEILSKTFKKLPAMVNMGDFNLHDSEEPGYKALVSNPDEQHRFYDPPFALDKKVTSPANWTDEPQKYSSFLTTSTRENKESPNACGTGGGAKLWFDHILLSQPLTLAANSIHYVPGSFHTIGNDGKRLGISANDEGTPNKAVPKDIANAIFGFSNKYPVTLELEIK